MFQKEHLHFQQSIFYYYIIISGKSASVDINGNNAETITNIKDAMVVLLLLLLLLYRNLTLC